MKMSVILVNAWRTKTNSKKAVGFSLVLGNEMKIDWCDAYENGAGWRIKKDGIKFGISTEIDICKLVAEAIANYGWENLPTRVFTKSNTTATITEKDVEAATEEIFGKHE